jgi:hypothetical protein
VSMTPQPRALTLNPSPDDGGGKEKCEKCALTPFHHKWGATKRSGVEAKPTVGDRGSARSVIIAKPTVGDRGSELSA